MASAAYGGETGVSVGRVFNRAFGVAKSNPATIFGIAFLVQALPSALINYLRLSVTGIAVTRDGTLGVAMLSLATSFIGLVLAMLVQGALVRATIAYTEGRRASFGESLSAGLEVALPLLGLAILMGLALAFGLALFLVPGVILYVMWAVASPALVEEKTGVFGAFGRSQDLTKGARWKVFGVEIVVLILLWLIYAVLVGSVMGSMGLHQFQTVGRAGGGLPFAWVIGNILVSTLVGALWSAIQTSLYVELRDWKDGPSTRGLEDIFS